MGDSKGTDLHFVHQSRQQGKNYKKIVELCKEVTDLEMKLSKMQPVFDAAVEYGKAVENLDCHEYETEAKFNAMAAIKDAWEDKMLALIRKLKS